MTSMVRPDPDCSSDQILHFPDASSICILRIIVYNHTVYVNMFIKILFHFIVNIHPIVTVASNLLQQPHDIDHPPSLSVPWFPKIGGRDCQTSLEFVSFTPWASLQKECRGGTHHGGGHGSAALLDIPVIDPVSESAKKSIAGDNICSRGYHIRLSGRCIHLPPSGIVGTAFPSVTAFPVVTSHRDQSVVHAYGRDGTALRTVISSRTDHNDPVIPRHCQKPV